VALADFVVVEIVRRRDLDAAAAEGRVDVVVGNDRDRPVDERQADLTTDEVAVALVVRVHGDRGVTEHRLGSRRGDNEVSGAVGERVAQVPEVPGLGFRDHFEVGKRRVQHRVPVHEPLSAIDQASLVQAHEDFGNRGRETFVHREAVARPVHGIAEAAHLPRDRAARLFLPLPDSLDELLAAEVLACLAHRVQLPLDDHLGRDACMVRTRLP